jgi:hypothetical protein
MVVVDGRVGKHDGVLLRLGHDARRPVWKGTGLLLCLAGRRGVLH